MTGREYAAVLREAADFFEAHPYLPIPDGAHSLVLFYEHPSPAETRWLTAQAHFVVVGCFRGLRSWHLKLRQSQSALRCEMDVDELSENPQMKTKDKCAHPACSCPAEEGSKYCSTYCHDAGSEMEIVCNCGHAACAEPAFGAA